MSGDVDGGLRVWSLEGRNCVNSGLGEAHDHSVLSVSRVRRGGEGFASCSRDGTVKVWDAETCSTGVPVTVLQTQARCFCNASTSDADVGDENLVLTGGAEESAVLLWDLRSARAAVSTVNMAAERGMVTSLLLQSAAAATADAESWSAALVGCDDGSLTCIDWRQGRAVSNIKLHEEESGPQPVFAIAAYSRQGGSSLQLLTGGGDCKLRRSSLTVHSLETRALQLVAETEAGSTASLPAVGTSCISVRCDGRIAASAHWDNTIRLHDLKRLRPLAVLRHHKESAFAVAFGVRGSPSQSLFASAGKDGLVSVWDLYADKMKD